MRTKLPAWLEMEMQVSTICNQIEETGWLVDRELIVHHITTLDAMIVALETVIMPQVPVHCVVLEACIERDDKEEPRLYNYVKRPFLKNGQWSASSVATWPEYTKESAPFEIVGPFTRVSFEKISLTSDKQVKRFLLSKGWEPLEWNISKKTQKVTSPKLTEESLSSIDNNVGQLIAQHIKSHHRRNQLHGWLEKIRPDGRLPMVIDPQGAPTARATHKNIVNVPSEDKASFFAKEMRSVFIAPSGKLLVGCDSMADQVRKLCHYMGDASFTKAVMEGKKEEGTDIHSFNMQATGLPSRGHAKNFFYGFIFGAGPTKIGKLIKRGPEEGKKIMARYFKNLPKLKLLIESLKTKNSERGYLKGLDSRPVRVRKEHELLCYLVQSAEAITMKLSLCYLSYWIKQEQLNAQIVGWIHDEYAIEVSEEQADRVAFLAEEAIRQAGRDMKLAVPSDGEAKIGKNWYEVH